MQLKEQSKKKMKHLVYEDISIQPYLSLDSFSLEEKKLLFSLRSNSYRANMSFKKMNRGNLNCSLKCCTEETQLHIFESFKPVLEKLGLKESPKLSLIYGTPTEQKRAIQVFLKIDDMRKHLQDNLLPGGICHSKKCR